MPLTKKGQKIMSNMKSQYGSKKGESVFYASRNAGKIQGVDPESSGSQVSRKRTDKPGRSIIDVECHRQAPETKTLDGSFTHPVHKGYDYITPGRLDPPSLDAHEVKQFTKGKQSCNRDTGQGVHYGAEVDFYGPDTDFRTEEINPHHYGRDYEPFPLRDYFKDEKKDERLSLRLMDEYEYEEVATPGTVAQKGSPSSMAWGSISYEKVPTENDDYRSFDSQREFRRSQAELEEDAPTVKKLKKY